MSRAFDDKPLAVRPEEHGILLWRVSGILHTNVPHLVVHHSLSGFEIGYAGSGPADLALNILEWQLRREGYRGQTITCYEGNCFRLAWNLHQDFKRDFLATCDRKTVEISLDALTNWLATNRMEAEPPRHWPTPEP